MHRSTSTSLVTAAAAAGVAALAIVCLAACGGAGKTASESGETRADIWVDDGMCGPDPKLEMERTGSWDPALRCRKDAALIEQCASSPNSASPRRPLFCAGEPTSAECGNRREAYLDAHELLRCVCMTDEQYAVAVDYCENAP